RTPAVQRVADRKRSLGGRRKRAGAHAFRVVVTELEKQTVGRAQVLIEPDIELVIPLPAARIEYEIARAARRVGRWKEIDGPGGRRIETLHWNPIARERRADLRPGGCENQSIRIENARPESAEIAGPVHLLWRFGGNRDHAGAP